MAFVIVLLAVICLQSSGAIQAQRPDGGDRRGVPCAHCWQAIVHTQGPAAGVVRITRFRGPPEV